MQEFLTSIGANEEMAAQLAGYGVSIVGVLVALFIAWMIAGGVKRWMLRGFTAAKFDPTLGKFFANLARWGILIAAVLGCLGVFGVDTTSFAAVIGAAGLAIGLAFQGTLANFSAGVMLLVFRPFKVGDVVTTAGVTAQVVEIELFTTELRTPNAVRIIVPNSSIFGANIENFTHYGDRRADVNVGCEYSADIDETRAVLEKAIANIEGAVTDPAPQVYLMDLGGSSVDWQLRCYCAPADFFAVRERMVRAAKYALDEAGIGIPFPQMDVHLDHVASASAESQAPN
jgi:small conductance mechanosensitive channel